MIDLSKVQNYYIACGYADLRHGIGTHQREMPVSTKFHRLMDRAYAWSGTSIAHVLCNMVYLGHTHTKKSTTISFKNKTRIPIPENERIIVKDTHPALITQEKWDIVQEVRSHKRRPPKQMEEPNLFAGLVCCADCGSSMVLYRTESIKKELYHLKCYTYGKKGKNACTPHQIRQDDLYQIVLDDLRRVTHFARKKERQFAAYITQKNSQELRKEITGLQKEVYTMERRVVELTSLFRRLYEDNVLARITNEQFCMLSADFNAEQKTLEEALPGKKARLEKLKASVSNVDAFVEKAKRFTTINELNPELLRLFILRIEIGERARKYSQNATQNIRIIYKDKGEQPVETAALPEENKDMQLLA